MAAGSDVYVLGGYMTDFARNWTKENKHFSALMRESVLGALEKCDIAPEEIESAHVGNFAAELYCMQGHLGAFFTEAHPAFSGLPTARHEAACASGSIAILVASAEIEAGRYDLQAVVGIEQMKTVSAAEGGAFLGTAAWYEQEAEGIEFPFPKLFGKLGDEYDKRYGLKDEYLAEISKINYANAKLNPNAQTRTWYMNKEHALCRTDDNPSVGGRIRISDCSQVTDGAVTVFLASREYAEKYAKGMGKKLADIPRIKGWGHNTARLKFDDKVAESHHAEYVLPHVRSTLTSAWKRAGVSGPEDIDVIETHDCFTTSEYMAIDHFGITKPGESWKAVEEGWLEIDGKHPINPSGGLIGAGHPVGATGVRQLLDCYKQVVGEAGAFQVEGAKNAQTLNIGGTGTTSCSFVVGR
ncbi:MAG: thiolase domain-containing protein [Deltaproteobacteria bacterium]|nr:thiolase domain-containing protein [Myxococcales bacterium]TDJ12166.1 MAG: thiolase domain-containing protein [Deltaproteobacteria bacterium]TDJ21191.1 MAG: thiolase domain-containing protein [Deltaproteobacteria bacterium]